MKKMGGVILVASGLLSMGVADMLVEKYVVPKYEVPEREALPLPHEDFQIYLCARQKDLYQR